MGGPWDGLALWAVAGVGMMACLWPRVIIREVDGEKVLIRR